MLWMIVDRDRSYDPEKDDEAMMDIEDLQAVKLHKKDLQRLFDDWGYVEDGLREGDMSELTKRKMFGSNASDIAREDPRRSRGVVRDKA